MRRDPETLLGPDLFVLSRLCSQALIQNESLDDWLGRMEADLDRHFPPPDHGQLRENPDLRRRLLRVMLRSIWKSTPQPALQFGLPRLSLPGRNERCHCGSGRKYKQCCQPLDQDIPFPEVNFLPTLLAQLPRKRWPELAGSRVDLERVEDTVRQWLEAGEDRAVVDLLEPWFARDSAFVGKNEFLFDGLLDAYSELRHPRKKASLIDRAARVGDRSIRSAAMQRQVSILADQGKFEQAWALFDQAQKSEPDSPGLSHLEVTTLIAEGREAEARQRADFWARRLARRHGSEFSPLIEFMKDIAKHGAAALGGRLAEEAGAGNLAAALSNAPAPAAMYSLDPVDGDAGPLSPTPALERALQVWREAIEPVDFFPGADRSRSGPAEELVQMLALLEDKPVLWQSFEVLGEMAHAMRELDLLSLEETVILPMLDRAERLLDLVLEKNKAQNCRLEWGHWDNRPALDLLGWRVALELSRPASPEHIERLERLLRLNPHDNQGMRMPLSRRYLESGRFEDALSLADKYPNDLPEMQYNRVLALFALERFDEAESQLKPLAGQYPKILDALLKSRLRRPKIDPRGVLLGGDDEAWMYREDYRSLWQDLGALRWAAKVHSSSNPK